MSPGSTFAAISGVMRLQAGLPVPGEGAVLDDGHLAFWLWGRGGEQREQGHERDPQSSPLARNGD